MNDLRENLGWIIGSAIGGALAIASWVWESGLLATLLGIIIGAGIAYFVQTRTQKRTWKREYSVKIVEEVYGALFRDIRTHIRNLEQKAYSRFGFQSWQEFQEDHRYFMVDEKFRERLDELTKEIDKYSDSCYRLNNIIIPRILNKTALEIFGFEPADKINLSVTYKKNYENTGTGINILDKFKKRFSITEIQKDGLEYVDKSEISNVGLKINYRKSIGSGRFESDSVNQIKLFWEQSLEKLEKNETYQYIVSKNEIILKEIKNIKKELVKRIEKPWKI